VQTAQPQVASGKLRAVGVMSAERSQAFPEVPTLKEQGLGDLEVETWYGAFAPEIRDFLAKQGMIAVGGPPDRLGELVKSELARWTRVVAAAGIKAD
jgi:tripartite-type tricarboxylate transporter receptor subunit TctC